MSCKGFITQINCEAKLIILYISIYSKFPFNGQVNPIVEVYILDTLFSFSFCYWLKHLHSATNDLSQL